MAKKATEKATRFPATAKALKQDLPAPAATRVDATPKVTKPATVTKKAMTKKEPKAKKMSALDAAAKVLGESGTAMTTGEMIEAMGKKGYWSSPNGLTPAATLSAAILRETSVKGKESRFTKTERGKFALKA